ncbi:hypothetical protein, partial [Intestinimonas massiliensis (ex Afouda et al. 2020)]|uniref:hypothetical protein n=1 Tax=Intestinimonas massiliensis (ex Afouda et al. 2020) TaxID=1673721 RepID=UPI0013EF1266
VPVSSDSASVPGILSAVSDVFAAVLGLVALLAAAFAVHPILLIGVVLGFFGLVIAIFRRLFVKHRRGGGGVKTPPRPSCV